jgi:hypothetical protein
MAIKVVIFILVAPLQVILNLNPDLLAHSASFAHERFMEIEYRKKVRQPAHSPFVRRFYPRYPRMTGRTLQRKDEWLNDAVLN